MEKKCLDAACFGKHDGFGLKLLHKYDVTLDIWLLNFGVRLPPPYLKGL